ncbi:MAG: sugar phosphate isomerase/epimerase family protein [Candidatus Zipacnadales bacterium]
MKFAICNEIFQGFSLEDQFATAKRLGYEAVEIAPFTIERHVTDIDLRQRERVLALAEEWGLEIAGIHWVLVGPEGLHLTSPDAQVRDRTVHYLCELVRFGVDIGGKVMVLGSPQQRNVLPGVDPEQAKAWFAQAIAKAASVPGAENFTICIEPLSSQITNLITNAAEAREMAHRINLPNVGVILDVNAMSHDEDDLPATIRATKAYLRHFHANDPSQRGPGWGDMDFHPVLEALLEIGYAGYVSVEVFDFTLDPVEHAEKSLVYLRETLEAVS